MQFIAFVRAKNRAERSPKGVGSIGLVRRSALRGAVQVQSSIWRALGRSAKRSALTSRSVCANLSEGWRKRRYKAVFVNKLSDAAQEAAETQTWLEFALKCNYIDEVLFKRLDDKIGRAHV